MDDDRLTENTRAAYPLSILQNASADRRGQTPKNVFLLTCDAYGVSPPIARLTYAQARTCFLLGFTSKVAGTERGVTGPTPTFSTCFGAPFLTRKPEVYADMLADRLARSGASVWLINTGWTGGGADTGQRMPIAATRAVLDAALSGALEAVSYRRDSVWSVMVPETGPKQVLPYLDPRAGWRDKQAFEEASARLRDEIVRQLAVLSVENNLMNTPALGPIDG